MKPALPILLLAALGASADAQPAASVAARANADYNMSVEAPWIAKVSDRHQDQLNVNVSGERGSMVGSNVAIADLAGLSRDALFGPDHPVRFELRRESGTIFFD